MSDSVPMSGGVALVLAAALGLATALVLGFGATDSPRASCPTGVHADPARAARVVRRLGSVAEGRALLRRAGSPLRLCFAASDGVARSDGVLVLPAEVGDAESAARLGHLLLHQIVGVALLAMTAVTEPCPVAVARAIEQEARAHALELELRRLLEVSPAAHRFPFEAAYWAAPPAERLGVVRTHLLAEATADLGLAAAYARSCREQRARARPEARP